MMDKWSGSVLLWIGVALCLAGCFASTLDEPETGTTTIALNESAPTATADLIEPIAVVSTSTPMADVPLHPLSIETLRQGDYPGSDFVVEQTLEPGSNYNRYVVSYQSEGLKIYALMTIPQEARPATGYPVIIFNHGYIPPDVYRTTERYIAYVDAFARNGYIVIKSDYRGHGISEGVAQSAYGSPGYVIDVLNAVASAKRHPDVDPNRIGMWGHSMGGYITLRAMVADPDIQAGVIWAGVVASYTDLFERWFRRTPRPDSWRNTMIETFGTPQENPAFWDSLSANSYLHDLSGPVQIHHATGDTSVPYEYSTTLDEQIRSAGQSSELFIYQGDDHNISGNLNIALTLSVVFFNQHVKGSYD